MDQTTLVQQTEIAGAILEELRYLGYMADLSYFDSERIILIVRLPDEPKTLFHIEIRKEQNR